MFWFGDSNIVIISGLSKTLAFFYYIILALAKLKYDFTQLLVMIGRNEAILMDKLGLETTEKFKELFNSKASMKERKKLLQELIETIHRQS